MHLNAGVHLKTAGTTWLEELIGLAEAGGDGPGAGKGNLRRGLCAPGRALRAIRHCHRHRLHETPSASEVLGWTSEQFTLPYAMYPEDRRYNSSLRQLLHVGFKVAAKMGPRYLGLLEANEDVIAKNVTENLFIVTSLPSS